jgi:hypothetical protein
MDNCFNTHASNSWKTAPISYYCIIISGYWFGPFFWRGMYAKMTLKDGHNDS